MSHLLAVGHRPVPSRRACPPADCAPGPGARRVQALPLVRAVRRSVRPSGGQPFGVVSGAPERPVLSCGRRLRYRSGPGSAEPPAGPAPHRTRCFVRVSITNALDVNFPGVILALLTLRNAPGRCPRVADRHSRLHPRLWPAVCPGAYPPPASPAAAERGLRALPTGTASPAISMTRPPRRPGHLEGPATSRAQSSRGSGRLEGPAIEDSATSRTRRRALEGRDGAGSPPARNTPRDHGRRARPDRRPGVRRRGRRGTKAAPAKVLNGRKWRNRFQRNRRDELFCHSTRAAP